MIISLIIPVRKSWELINSFVEAIPDNSYGVEVLLIFDSDDEATKYAANYAETSGRNIRSIESDSIGLYGAMNCGISNAKGKYLLFLGIDDNFDFASCDNGLLQFLEKKNETIILMPIVIRDLLEYKIKPPGDCNIPAILHHQSILFNREFIIKNGLKYDLTFKIHSDFDFIQRVLLSRNSTRSFIQVPLVVFSKGGVSTSRLQILKSLKELFDIFSKYNALWSAKFFLAVSRKISYLLR